MDSWGEEYAEGAHGMEYHVENGEEFLYLATTKLHTVVKTMLAGEKVFELGYPKESGLYESAEQYNPTNIAVMPDGAFYVADGYGLSYIHQYTKDAEYVRSWGGKGAEQGQLNCPHGIWLDTRGDSPALIVADRANERLQYFTLDGTPLKLVHGDLRHPCHFDQRGEKLLVPGLFGCVNILDGRNEVVAQLGLNSGVNKQEGYPNLPHDQREPGKFISPHGASWDSAGNIFVAEWINDGRVSKLRKIG